MLTPTEIGTLLRTANRLEQESDPFDSDVQALKAIARRVQSPYSAPLDRPQHDVSKCRCRA